MGWYVPCTVLEDRARARFRVSVRVRARVRVRIRVKGMGYLDGGYDEERVVP